MTMSLLVMTVVGVLCLGWVNATTCTSFDLPDPTQRTPSGDPSNVERRVLRGQSYCKELTLKELNGKTPKLCVRNEKSVDRVPTGCLRLNLRHVAPGLVKELRVGIHPDCSSIPANRKDKFQRRRFATKMVAGRKMGAIRVCFDEIPAAKTCCETEQCLLFEAIVEVAGADTLVTVEDGTCSSEEGCPYSIGCPNLINENDKLPGLNFSAFRGTESNDLFILNENEEVLNYAVPYGGYDVVIGTEGKDALAGGFTSEGGITAFLKGGNDTFESGSGQAKIYLGKGDDHVRSIIGPDGYQDFYYGGEGLDMITGIYDDTDILKSIENRPS